MEEKEKIDFFNILTRIEDKVDTIIREQGITKRSLDNLDSDREIFINIQGKLASIDEQLRISRHHDGEATKDIKTEVQVSADALKEAVTNEVQEIKDIVQNKKIIIAKPKSFLQKIFRR